MSNLLYNSFDILVIMVYLIDMDNLPQSVPTNPTTPSIPSTPLPTVGTPTSPLANVIANIDISTKEKMSLAIEGIIKVRLANELKLIEAIAYGVDTDQMTVENAIIMTSKLKDSITELVKVKGMLDGNIGVGNSYNTLIINAVARAEEIYDRVRPIN